MPGSEYAGWRRVVAAEGLVVGARDFAAAAHEVVGALELGQSDGGVHVGQIVLEAHVVDFVVPRAALVVALPRVLVHPVQAGDRDFFRERVVGGGDHAALGGGEIFGGVETEAGEVADGADFRHPAAVHVTRGAGGVRGVLDNFQIVGARDVEDPIHVASMTGEVHRQDRADAFVRAALERLLDARGIDVEGAGIDVDEHRARAEVAENLGGRGESERRGDNLVAGADAERPQREMKRAGAMRKRERVFGADVIGEFALEALGLGAGGDPSGAQGVEYLALLVGSDGRTMKCYLSHCV